MALEPGVGCAGDRIDEEVCRFCYAKRECNNTLCRR